MSEDGIKVTDKRMFTPDGELREEFRHLEKSADAASEGSRVERESAPPPRAPSGPGAGVARPGESADAGRAAARESRFSPPGAEPALGKPGFLDLVSLIAQPIALYLGDATLPDGRSAENLELARLYIDLLELLRGKTKGNLTAEELTFLDNLLYELRLRYVKKSG